MTARTTLLFPIETINREIDFRLVLACLCARPDNRIFIGHSETIFDLVKELKGGVYVGKNIRPNPLPEEARSQRQYRRLKEQGVKLVWLDEEGGVFWGQREEWEWTMLQSLDPAKLSADDAVCTWGDVQRDFYRAANPPRPDAINTTGHPRFDLYKPEYRRYYDRDVNALRERYGDFVLINTNFHRAYTPQNLKKIFGARPRLNPAGFDHGESVERWSHLLNIFNGFVCLAARLSRERPELNIVIRPHPSENIKFYRTIFEGVPNVHVLHEGAVGPWLLAARAMIHDGCTTAIEAHFCGTPIINYKPLADERFDCQLPNQFGTRCVNEEEVLRYLDGVLSRPREATTGPAPDGVSGLIANFHQDAFAALSERILLAAQYAPQISEARGSWFSWGKNSQGKKQDETTAQATSQAPPLRGEGGKQDGLMEKFYSLRQAGIAEKVQAAQSLIGREVKYSLVSDTLMRVEV